MSSNVCGELPILVVHPCGLSVACVRVACAASAHLRDSESCDNASRAPSAWRPARSCSTTTELTSCIVTVMAAAHSAVECWDTASELDGVEARGRCVTGEWSELTLTVWDLSVRRRGAPADECDGETAQLPPPVLPWPPCAAAVSACLMLSCVCSVTCACS